MAKKSKSKPMKEILERLSMFKYITVVIFEEDVILNEPVENWPLCDCLISFHSKGKSFNNTIKNFGIYILCFLTVLFVCLFFSTAQNQLFQMASSPIENPLNLLPILLATSSTFRKKSLSRDFFFLCIGI